MDELLICRLGSVPYNDALESQERLREARKAEAIGDLLLLLEHPPVYTRGRRSTDEELPFGADWYAERGIEIVDVLRGGKVTYHGPGQLIAYPIVRIGDVVAFVRLVERAAVSALAAHGVRAYSRAEEGRDFTGVWVGGRDEDGPPRKIGAIGLHVSGQVTTHGLAINVDANLDPFGWIVACGLPDAQVTSVAREGGDADIDRFANSFAASLAAELHAAPRTVELDQLDLSAVSPRR